MGVTGVQWRRLFVAGTWHNSRMGSSERPPSGAHEWTGSLSSLAEELRTYRPLTDETGSKGNELRERAEKEVTLLSEWAQRTLNKNDFVQLDKLIGQIHKFHLNSMTPPSELAERLEEIEQLRRRLIGDEESQPVQRSSYELPAVAPEPEISEPHEVDESATGGSGPRVRKVTRTRTRRPHSERGTEAETDADDDEQESFAPSSEETVREHRERLRELTREYRAVLMRREHGKSASEESATVSEPVAAPEDKSEEKPIVMLNSVLSRQAGLSARQIAEQQAGILPKQKAVNQPAARAARLEEADAKKARGRRARRLGFLGAGLAAALGFMHGDTREESLHTHKPVPASAPAAPSQAPVAKAAASSAEAPRVVTVPKQIEVSIDKKGEGAIKLYEKLATKLQAEYPNQKEAPAIVQKILSYKNGAAFATEMGFMKFPQSAVMRMKDAHFEADTFRIDPVKGTLVYIDSKKEPHVLVEQTKPGTFTSHPQQVTMRTYARAEVVSSALAPLRDESVASENGPSMTDAVPPSAPPISAPVPSQPSVSAAPGHQAPEQPTQPQRDPADVLRDLHRRYGRGTLGPEDLS